MKILELTTKEELNKLMEQDQQMIPQPELTISFPDNTPYEVAKLVQDFVAPEYTEAAIGHYVPVMSFKHEVERDAFVKFLKSKGIKYTDEK